MLSNLSKRRWKNVLYAEIKKLVLSSIFPVSLFFCATHTWKSRANVMKRERRSSQLNNMRSGKKQRRNYENDNTDTVKYQQHLSATRGNIEMSRFFTHHQNHHSSLHQWYSSDLFAPCWDTFNLLKNKQIKCRSKLILSRADKPIN